MNYCDVTALSAMLNGSQQPDDVSETLYSYICPPLVIGCLISVFLNAALLTIGHFKIHNKSPILLLSLNLATTDTIASLLVAIGFVFNSYLPKVYNIRFSPCPMLAFEICRTSALIASVTHLFALAFIHYRGIVKPLHYRGFTFFCTNHMTHSINCITIISWIVPLITFTLYFSTIPCQGFLSPTCNYLFLASKRYRFFLLTTFLIPLVLMFLLYIRIFMIITKNQKRRSQLTSHMSIIEPKKNRSTNDSKNLRTADSSSTYESNTENQIPKINLEQKLTLKRSFYGKIGLLTRTLSTKSYTNRPNKLEMQLNVIKKESAENELIMNSEANKNNRLSKNSDQLVNESTTSRNSLINKTTRTRLIRYYENELNDYGLINEQINDEHVDLNSNIIIKNDDDDLKKNTKSTNVDNLKDHNCCSKDDISKYIKQVSLINDEQQSVADKNEQKTNQLDYNDFKDTEQSNEQLLNVKSEIELNVEPNLGPNVETNVKSDQKQRQQLLNKFKCDHNLKSTTCINCKKIDKTFCSTESTNLDKNNSNLKNLEQQTNLDNLDQINSLDDKKELNQQFDYQINDPLDDRKELISKEINLNDLDDFTLSNNRLTTSPTNHLASNKKLTNDLFRTNSEQKTTSEKQTLTLVKKSSTCSNKSNRSFKSIKSVEIKDDLSGSDQRSQKDRLDNASLSNSPIKLNTSSSQLNYSRKLKNKLNASIQGRSVRFHTKALFTTLTILGTYLICIMPALIFLVLTCVDGCLYPLFTISIKNRVVISVVTNSLVIIKAITDPFIYIYRIQEVKLAVRQCAIYKIFFLNAKKSDHRHPHYHTQIKTAKKTPVPSINNRSLPSLLIKNRNPRDVNQETTNAMNITSSSINNTGLLSTTVTTTISSTTVTTNLSTNSNKYTKKT